MAEKESHCGHDEELDQAGRIGTCKICGQEKQYDPEGKQPPKVIRLGTFPPKPQEVEEKSAPEYQSSDEGKDRRAEKKGRLANLGPSKFSRAERVAMAAEALRDGYQVVADRYGVPKPTVVGWCRRLKKRGASRADSKAKMLEYKNPVRTSHEMRSSHDVGVYIEALRRIKECPINDEKATARIDGMIEAFDWVLGKTS